MVVHTSCRSPRLAPGYLANARKTYPYHSMPNFAFVYLVNMMISLAKEGDESSITGNTHSDQEDNFSIEYCKSRNVRTRYIFVRSDQTIFRMNGTFARNPEQHFVHSTVVCFYLVRWVWCTKVRNISGLKVLQRSHNDTTAEVVRDYHKDVTWPNDRTRGVQSWPVTHVCRTCTKSRHLYSCSWKLGKQW